MEWIQTNEARIPQLDRKGFINAISVYCDDKKIKGALAKVWKQYLAVCPPQTQLEANDANTHVPRTSETQNKKQEEEETDMKSTEIQTGRTAAMTEDTETKEETQQDSMRTNKDEESESEDSESCYASADRALKVHEQMPTYIHRAIWFRSDDETLERLVDRAVKFVCKSPL
eukprot:21557_1